MGLGYRQDLVFIDAGDLGRDGQMTPRKEMGQAGHSGQSVHILFNYSAAVWRMLTSSSCRVGLTCSGQRHPKVSPLNLG